MPAALATKPSHVVSDLGDRVVIKDLELFVGFDPELDDPEDDKFSIYDKAKIHGVVSRTRSYMKRGQYPKLILRHNPDDADMPDRPVLGDVTTVSARKIGKVWGVVGDVEMGKDDFESFIKSNAYQRRSAEIWPDGYMSEVALLGSETPARPLPDTKFMKNGAKDVFTRSIAPIRCQEPTPDFTEAGPNNANPNGGRAKDKPMPLTDEELQELKDKNKALEDENCDLKEKLKAQEEEGDGEDEEKDKAQEEEDEDAEAEKEMNRRSRASVVKLKRENATIKRRLDIVKDELVVERYSRELDTMENEGYTFSDEQRSEVLSRIKAARDPDSELDFVKSLMHRHPVGLRIDQTHSRPAGASRKTIKSRKDAAQRAQDRCMKEGKPEMFTQYLAEEKAA